MAPDHCRISNIVPVPKKGDLTDTNNYRIPLTSLVATTLNRMILNRIQPEIEKKLRDNQNGFREGRCTTSHILAPYLFIIKVDYCMRLALKKHQDIGFTLTPARSRRVKVKKVSDTEFADDIALVTDTVKEAEDLMREVERVSMSVGLRLNETRTKYLVENIQEPEEIVCVDVKPIELVDDFLYLGVKIRNTEEDLAERKKKAWAACHCLKSVWKLDFWRDLKIRLFTTMVESVLLYGSETWTLTKHLTKMVTQDYLEWH